MQLTDEQIAKMLRTPIPGGSNAADWFLPHDSERGKENIYDVVRRMFAAIPEAPPAVVGRKED